MTPFYKAMLMTFLMTMPILLYGMDMARSIVEEKSSRIFEVMLAVARPDDMLTGKLLGVGAVGLTQIAIWIAAAILLSGSALLGPILSGEYQDPLHAARSRSLSRLLPSRLLPLQRVLLRPRRHLRNRAGPADVHHARRHPHLDQLRHPALSAQQSQLALGRRRLPFSAHRAARHGPAHRHVARAVSLVADRHSRSLFSSSASGRSSGSPRASTASASSCTASAPPCPNCSAGCATANPALNKADG